MRSSIPGRPTDPQKLEDILDAVLQGFAEGDLHFTIEGTARRAGVSKGTIYRHFSNADALLEAVLERVYQQIAGHAPLDQSPATDLRTQLVALGLQLLDFLAGDQGVRIMRTVIAHGARHPDHGELIYRAGPLAFIRRAAEYLEQAASQGQLELDAPLERAEQLIGMWKGSLVNGLLMNGRPLPDAAEKRRRVESAVDLLLMALAPRQPG
jgi:TetR/AcrR family transcriptional regulator, mexJK operon transcriptional repressor